MKRLFEQLRRRWTRSPEAPAPPPLDLDAELRAIRDAEAEEDIGLGKRIHQFSYRGLDLRLDRDATGLYRVTVSEGPERRYSFTVVCEKGDYATLRLCYDEIVAFLDGDRQVAKLPQQPWLKGHFYGA